MDNLRDTIGNVTKSVYRTSKGFLKTTKLSMDIASEESKLKSIYTEIGKKVHEIYAYGGSLGKFFDEKYKELLDCEQKLDVLRRNLDEAKGTRTCPKCGKSAAASAEFCPKCGTRLDESLESVTFQNREPRSESRDSYLNNTAYRVESGYTGPQPAYTPGPDSLTPPPHSPEPAYSAPPPASYGSESGYAASPPPYGSEADYVTPPPITTPTEHKQCPLCGKNNAPENKFCFSCGRAL